MVKPYARRHHYLTRGYLASFTNSGCIDGKFTTLDVQTGISFLTSPVNVGVEMDFNRIDIEGHSIDAIEKAISTFESEVVIAIRKVINTQTFPNDNDFNLILNLLGLFAVRNPRMRKSFNRSREQVLHGISSLLVSDEKIWNHYLKIVRESGEKISNNVMFEDIKRFVEDGNYDIEFHPQENIVLEFQIFDELLPVLGKREWSVLVAPANGPEFICSDHPVTLTWKDECSFPIGYELKDTEVFFPLGRRIGVYGVFESPLKPVVRCKPIHVAIMNSRVVQNSERHVYSAQKSFVISDKGKIFEIRCEV